MTLTIRIPLKSTIWLLGVGRILRHKSKINCSWSKLVKLTCSVTLNMIKCLNVFNVNSTFLCRKSFGEKTKYLGSDRKTVFNSLKSQTKYVRVVFGSCARISAIK